MGKTRTDGAERNLGQDDLSEYLRAKEPGRAELAGIWRAAIGLQKVDGLTPSAYLVETARRNIEGEITIAEAGKIIGEYYKSKAVRAEAAKTRTDEADIVSRRTSSHNASPKFSPSRRSRFRRNSLFQYTAGFSMESTNMLARSATTTSPRTNGF